VDKVEIRNTGFCSTFLTSLRKVEKVEKVNKVETQGFVPLFYTFSHSQVYETPTPEVMA